MIADAVRIQELELPPDSPEIAVRAGGELVFDEGQFSFAAVTVGGTRSQTFTVRNEGSADLTLQPIAVSGSKFTLASPNFTAGQILAAGAEASFTIDVETSSIGTFHGSLSFSSSDADESPFDLSLVATVREVAPASVLIDDGDPGFQLTGNWFHIANYGYAGDAKAIGAKVTETAIWTFDALTPGQYEISLTWLNGSDRASNVTYAIRDGVGGPILSTVLIDQRARPGGPVIGGRPFADLGEVTITSDALVVEVSNAGADGALIADAMRIAALTPPPESPEISVGEGSLTVLDGSSVDLGSAQQGDATLTKTFTIQNTGTADLTLEPIVVTGAGFSLTSANLTSGQILVPGASVSFSIGLATTTAGTFQGSVSFLNGDADESPFDFAVSGSIRVPQPAGVHLIDNGDAGFNVTGNWADVVGYGYGSDSLAGAARNGVDTAQWVFVGLTAGTYEVAATWLPGTDRADNVTYVIRDGVGGTILGTVTVDQRPNPSGDVHGGRRFQLLSQFTITGDTLVVELSTAGTTGAVIADAIRIERL